MRERSTRRCHTCTGRYRFQFYMQKILITAEGGKLWCACATPQSTCGLTVVQLQSPGINGCRSAANASLDFNPSHSYTQSNEARKRKERREEKRLERWQVSRTSAGNKHRQCVNTAPRTRLCRVCVVSVRPSPPPSHHLGLDRRGAVKISQEHDL